MRLTTSRLSGVSAGRNTNNWWPTGASMSIEASADRARVNGVSGSVASFLATTRSSTGTAPHLDGSLQTFAVNIPRITDKGLLIEETRTNGVRNSNMVGAAIGVFPDHFAGTPTITVVGVGASHGSNFIDVRFQGVNNAGVTDYPNIRFNVPAIPVSGNSISHSAYLQLLSGEVTQLLSLQYREFTDGAPGSFQPGPVSLTTSRLRTVVTDDINPLTTHATGSSLVLTVPNTQSYDFTVRIWAPQLEVGGAASSPILTTGVAAIRASDDIKFANLDWMTSTGTLLIEAKTSTDWTTKPGNNYLLGGGSSERFVYGNAGNGNLFGFDGVNSIVHGAVGDAALFKLAIGYSPATGMSSSLNGAPVVTSSVIIPKPSLLWLGRRWDGAFHWNASIKSITNLPTRVSNSELESLSGGA